MENNFPRKEGCGTLPYQLSQKYTERMSGGNPDRTFSSQALGMAYVIGAEATRTRICNIIRHSSLVGGLTSAQAQTLLDIIDEIENTPQ